MCVFFTVHFKTKLSLEHAILCAKCFTKAMKHVQFCTGPDSSFTKDCALVPVANYSNREKSKAKHATALLEAIHGHNAYLNTRQVRRLELSEFCNLCATDKRRTCVLSRILFDNKATYGAAGVAFEDTTYLSTRCRLAPSPALLRLIISADNVLTMSLDNL